MLVKITISGYRNAIKFFCGWKSRGLKIKTIHRISKPTEFIFFVILPAKEIRNDNPNS